MVNVTCNGMRILVVFVDVYEKCDHLFFGFVFVYGHFVYRGHCVSQWTQVCFEFKFLCLHVLFSKTESKEKLKMWSLCVCCIRKAKQKTCNCFTLLLFTIL